MNDKEKLAAEILASLAWIVEFCDEHPEWFGQLDATQGAEYEWLENARKLLYRPVTKLPYMGQKPRDYIAPREPDTEGFMHKRPTGIKELK